MYAIEKERLSKVALLLDVELRPGSWSAVRRVAARRRERGREVVLVDEVDVDVGGKGRGAGSGQERE